MGHRDLRIRTISTHSEVLFQDAKDAGLVGLNKFSQPNRDQFCIQIRFRDLARRAMSDGYFRGRPKRSSLFGICMSSHVVRHLQRFFCFLHLSLLRRTAVVCSFLDTTLSSHPCLPQPPPEGAIIILLYDLRSSWAVPFSGSPSQHKEIRNGFTTIAWPNAQMSVICKSTAITQSHPMGNSENRNGATECWLLCYASARDEDRRCQFITRPVGRLTKLWISDLKSSRHGRRQCFSSGRRLFETSRSNPQEVNAHCAHFSRRSQPQIYYKYMTITISASKYRICMSTWPSYASGKCFALKMPPNTRIRERFIWRVSCQPPNTASKMRVHMRHVLEFS